MDSNTGILLVGHGSRQPYNKQVITDLANKFKENMDDYPIEVGFMELVEPNIPTAFNKLKQKGVNRIIVNPIFLAHGMHTKVDIPSILNLEPMKIEHKHSHGHNHSHSHSHHHHRDLKSEPVDFDGEIIYLEPLGSHDKIIEIIEERINENITQNDENVGILLVGHGSSLPFNNEVIDGIRDKLLDKYDYPIEAGYMRLSKPSIPESFKKIQEGNVEKIVVVPVFLAHGIHTKLDIPTTLGLNPDPIPDYPEPNVPKDDVIEFDGQLVYTEPIGADDKIAEILKERINI